MQENDAGPAPNFPPRGSDKWIPKDLPGLLPTRDELTVDNVGLGFSKPDVLDRIGAPHSTEQDDCYAKVEHWHYNRPTGAYPRSMAEAGRFLLVTFDREERVRSILGGCLRISDREVTRAGIAIDDKVDLLGKPVTDQRPLPPYYQYIAWESSDWSVAMESENIIKNVCLAEPWWPPSDDDDGAV